MIRCLRPVFDLAEALVDIAGGFPYGLSNNSGVMKWEQEQVAK